MTSRRWAARIIDGAGPGHEMTTEVGPNRVRVEVRTATFEAMRAEAKHRTLTRAIDRGRRMTPPLDFTGALIVWLRPQLAVDEKIGAKVPDGPRGKFVLVRRVGGPFEWPVKDQPDGDRRNVGVHPRPSPRPRPKGAGPHLVPLRPHHGIAVQVYNIEETAGPTWFPDPDSAEPRYMFTVIIPYKELMEVT